MNTTNPTGVVPLPFLEARTQLEESEETFEKMIDLSHDGEANGLPARLALHRAKHNREAAAVNATLALALEVREARLLLEAWLTQCTQVVI